MSKDSDFKERLDRAIEPYKQGIKLIDKLLSERINSQEIILLTCARLDSLANLINKKKSLTQKQAFVQLLFSYSGERRFYNSISIGDLYSNLCFYAEFAEGGLVYKPGRVQKFGPESEDFLYFIEKSLVPITGESVRKITQRVIKVLEKYFRVKPGQRKSKKYLSSSTEIKNIIKKEFRSPDPSVIIKAIDHLIEKFKVGSILYDRYRCGVIHGFKVELNEEEFFTATKPFHGVFLNVIAESYFNIEFPGKYLKTLLDKILTTIAYEFRETKRIPIDLLNELYTFDELVEDYTIDYLDSDSVEDFVEVKWQLKRR